MTRLGGQTTDRRDDVSDEIASTSNQADGTVSRRDGVRRAAVLALGAGLGVPSILLANSPSAGRIQLRFYKAANDGGTLVGTVELSDALTAFLTSTAGTRALIKWYDGAGREALTMSLPVMCCDKRTG